MLAVYVHTPFCPSKCGYCDFNSYAMTGEIVDYSCYLQVGKHGGKHRDCGQKCLRNGQPIGLLTKDGRLFLLMEEEHHPRRDSKTHFRDAAIEHLSHIMEVTGTNTQVEGQRAIYVSGFVNSAP